MHTILETIERGICIGCGACAVAARVPNAIVLDENGMWTANLDALRLGDMETANKVCPFSDRAPSEDEISSRVHPTVSSQHEYLGRYTQAYIGRVDDDEYLKGSSSGGMTSWVISRLLDEGIIDEVINVGRSKPGSETLFEFVESNADGLLQNRKSQYYSVSLDQALQHVRELDRKFAIVGVPCFIKAARLLAEQDPVLKERLVFYAGLVCGHMKSHFFGESLAWQVGVEPSDIDTIDFRVKNPARSASNYDFGAKSKSDGQWHHRRTKDLVGGTWGYAAFQPEACNFCDDIFAETADITFGDAWLPEYRAEWRGTNVVVSRSVVADRIIAEGMQTGELQLNIAPPDTVAESQAGNFRHRRVGLAVRMADDISQGLSVPRKRVEPGYSNVDPRRIRIIRQRRALSKLSFAAFRSARDQDDLGIYLKAMGRGIAKYRRIETPLWRRITRRASSSLTKLRSR